MRLSEEQSRQVLRNHGIYLSEVCDRCGTALGPIRWTIRGEPGAWCSQKCRDGVERKARACYGCGVSIREKRKGARFCSDVCRMRRQRVLGRPNNPKTNIQNTTVTDTIPAFGYETPLPGNLPPKSSAVAILGFGYPDRKLQPDMSKNSRKKSGYIDEKCGTWNSNIEVG